LPVRKFVLFTF
jgi:hypothetical protein